ncbi:MAG: hypothetical protein ACF8GE_09180 [Phycisphaerales bacterium JB043]
MTTQTHNQRVATRALASTGLSLLTLVTLMACLTPSHAHTTTRESATTRVSSIFIANTAIVIVASIEGSQARSNSDDAPPTITTLPQDTRGHLAPSNEALRAIPPPYC